MPVIFLRTNELFQFGRTTAASQYFLQMAGFLGIPVIAWNADNAGLETVRETYDLQFWPSGNFFWGDYPKSPKSWNYVPVKELSF